MASGGRASGDLKVWDLTRPEESGWIPAVDAAAPAFDPAGRSLRSVRIDGWLDACEPDSGAAGRGLRLDPSSRWMSPATAATYSMDRGKVASVADGRSVVKLWDAERDQELASLGGRHPWIRVCEVATGEPVLSLPLADSAVVSLSYHEGGTLIAAADRSGNLAAWDASPGSTVLRRGGSEAAHHLAFAPDGRRQAAAGRERTQV